MKRIILVALAVLMFWIGGMAQEQDKVRLGVGTGVNMTYNADIYSVLHGHSINKMLPGFGIYGLANMKLGDGVWMAEGRLDLTLNRWKYRLSDVNSKYHSDSMWNLRLPIMIGNRYGVSDVLSIYWCAGPSVSYSNYRFYNWMIGVNIKIGVEINSHHRIEAAYTYERSYQSADGSAPPRLHIVGMNYAYVF